MAETLGYFIEEVKVEPRSYNDPVNDWRREQAPEHSVHLRTDVDIYGNQAMSNIRAINVTRSDYNG